MYILIERRTKKDCIFLNGNTAYKTINRAAKIELTGDVVSIALADKEQMTLFDVVEDIEAPVYNHDNPLRQRQPHYRDIPEATF